MKKFVVFLIIMMSLLTMLYIVTTDFSKVSVPSKESIKIKTIKIEEKTEEIEDVKIEKKLLKENSEENLEENFKMKLILSEVNLEEEKYSKLDLNTATREEMLIKGLNLKIINKILIVREEIGSFRDISDLKKINGIGESTLVKLKEQLEIREKPKMKTLYINKASTEILSYYGFSKNEIKKIEQVRNKSKIRNNLELKNMISKKNYNELKDIIEY